MLVAHWVSKTAGSNHPVMTEHRRGRVQAQRGIRVCQPGAVVNESWSLRREPEKVRGFKPRRGGSGHSQVIQHALQPIDVGRPK